MNLEAVHQKIYEEGTPSQLFLWNFAKILSRIIGLSKIVRRHFGRTLFGGCFYTNLPFLKGKYNQFWRQVSLRKSVTAIEM